jgi:hypothetical protein
MASRFEKTVSAWWMYLFAQHALNELLEVAQTVLSMQHQFALAEEARLKSALDRFTENDVFYLHLVDELGKALPCRTKRTAGRLARRFKQGWMRSLGMVRKERH